MPAPSNNRQFGFTLVELLVSLAIVAMLAAISVAAFGRARERARQATCASNMKQVGLGVMMYKQDNDEYYPCGLIPGGPLANGDGAEPGYGAGWAGSVNTYVRNANVFACPDDTTLPGEGAHVVSYAMNQWLPSRHAASLTLASETVELFEVKSSWTYLSYPDEGVQELGGAPNYWLVSPVGDGWGYNPADAQGAFWNNDYTDDVNCTTTPCTRNAIQSWESVAPATSGDFARHDGSSDTQGLSMYLMADGHVKMLRFDNVGCSGNTPPAISALGVTSTPPDFPNSTCGPFSATFSPQ